MPSIDGWSFENKTVPYVYGEEQSIEATYDSLPKGVSIRYSRAGYPIDGNIATDVGIYEVTAILYGFPFKTKVVGTATFTIEAITP